MNVAGTIPSYVLESETVYFWCGVWFVTRYKRGLVQKMKEMIIKWYMWRTKNVEGKTTENKTWESLLHAHQELDQLASTGGTVSIPLPLRMQEKKKTQIVLRTVLNHIRRYLREMSLHTPIACDFIPLPSVQTACYALSYTCKLQEYCG